MKINQCQFRNVPCILVIKNSLGLVNHFGYQGYKNNTSLLKKYISTSLKVFFFLLS